MLTRLVLLDRVRDRRVEPTLTAVPLLDALMELLPQTSALSKVETPLQRLCGLVGRCGVFRLTYSEVENTASLVRVLLTSGARPQSSGSPSRSNPPGQQDP